MIVNSRAINGKQIIYFCFCCKQMHVMTLFTSFFLNKNK